jgi:site-specific DNA-methyltransferase (adenine-specific)
VIPIREEIIKFCEIIGFDYMGAIIWQKVTTSNTTGGGIQMGSYPYPRNGILKLDYEFIIVLKKLGDSPKPTKEQKELSKMTPEEWNTYFSGHWNFPGTKQTGHIAMFPEELPKRLIKMFSFVGETVLDPFAGSGTTALAAKNCDRNSVNYEINADFIPIIQKKLDVHQQSLYGTKFEFVVQSPNKLNLEEEVKKLPYIFKDPHSLDKKIDIKKLQFGSKIDKESLIRREELFTVKEIVSTEKIILSNNLTIKLLGVKEEPKINGKAVSFLIEKTKGKRVFLKFDKIKYDFENNLLCYLYLENKTFLNAHLIKNGLAKVDESYDFKYKNKFLTLLQQKDG